jgi:hypothetical protein
MTKSSSIGSLFKNKWLKAIAFINLFKNNLIKAATLADC